MSKVCWFPKRKRKFLKLILRNHNEKLILGVRKFEGKVPLRSRFGNAVTRAVFSLASGKKLWDTQTGLRAFRTELIPFMLNIKGDRYEYADQLCLMWSRLGRSSYKNGLS